jgi:hypothetical protein
MGGARRVSPVLLLTQVAVSSSSSGAGAGAIVVVMVILYCGGALFSRMGFLFFFPLHCYLFWCGCCNFFLQAFGVSCFPGDGDCVVEDLLRCVCACVHQGLLFFLGGFCFICPSFVPRDVSLT